jgi:hypothetical protein
MFYKKEGKWTEVPYIQLFFFLRDHPKWLSKCRLDTQTVVTYYKKPLNSFEEPEPKKPSNAQGPSTMSKWASPVTEIQSPGEPQRIYPILRIYPEVEGELPYQLPLYHPTQQPHTPDISHRTLSPPVDSWRG